ncbi:MAG: pyridoxine 5'-phosphate synthase, partial [Planctomycetota bacterium]|nr:pyridoxine 5'-phosphate synthase [Planctomycetota bacterium]
GQVERLKDVVARLQDAGLIVSAFIDAEPRQIEAAQTCGFQVCEIHTGPYAHAFYHHGRDARSKAVVDELEKIRIVGKLIGECGMRFNAGHALNYFNVQPIAALLDLRELHIGHSIVSRAIFVGIRQAVADMKALMREAAANAPTR